MCSTQRINVCLVVSVLLALLSGAPEVGEATPVGNMVSTGITRVARRMMGNNRLLGSSAAIRGNPAAGSFGRGMGPMGPYGGMGGGGAMGGAMGGMGSVYRGGMMTPLRPGAPMGSMYPNNMIM